MCVIRSFGVFFVGTVKNLFTIEVLYSHTYLPRQVCGICRSQSHRKEIGPRLTMSVDRRWRPVYRVRPRDILVHWPGTENDNDSGKNVPVHIQL